MEALISVPKDWVCRPEDCDVYYAEREWIEMKVRCESRKVFVPGMERADVEQAARALALYAISIHDPERGSLKAVVGRVIYRGLAMLIGQALARRRKPSGGWIPIDDEVCRDLASDNQADIALERRIDWEERARQRRNIQRYKQLISDDAREVLEVLLAPPPEVLVSARNRWLGYRGRPTAASLVRWFGWSSGRVERALMELRDTAVDYFGRKEKGERVINQQQSQ